MKFLTKIYIILFFLSHPIIAFSSDEEFKKFISENKSFIHKSSAKTITPIIDEISKFNSIKVEDFLTTWREKKLWYLKEDGKIIKVSTKDKKNYELTDFFTNKIIGNVGKKEIKQIKPNSGVRAIISSALVKFQLQNEDLQIRKKTFENLSRNPKEKFRILLREAIINEVDPTLREKMERFEKLLTVKFEKDIKKRIDAILSFKNDLGIDVRGALNQLLETTLVVKKEIPEGTNVSQILIPEFGYLKNSIENFKTFIDDKKKSKFTDTDAYGILVNKNIAPAPISNDKIKEILSSQLEQGFIDLEEIKTLNSLNGRLKVFNELVREGIVEKGISIEEMTLLVKQYKYFYEYVEPSKEITDTVSITLNSINKRVGVFQFIDLTIEGISLASIYFLAAIGLAITFGVMRVINMAHGEFIMMGAYSGYVVQQFITNYTISILISIPIAFLITFFAGVIMERLVIRKLYKRPLETLLATFGISIALQQLAKIIFGSQARPLTSPSWLDGSLVINEIISISWIRVAILFLSIIFTLILVLILNKTRFGLETRAVTQNPKMAASMGVNPERINMLTFGLGSGIAGIAGVGIGLYAKVTSELGADYIVQSFMTVVVGGVGSIWGTLAGATLIGFLQKGIEWFNPSNTLAAQTYMIIFIIIFIQFRPKGIIALKGRAAGD